MHYPLFLHILLKALTIDISVLTFPGFTIDATHPQARSQSYKIQIQSVWAFGGVTDYSINGAPKEIFSICAFV
jgi:hypothetical protein